MADTLVSATLDALGDQKGFWGPYWISTSTAIVVFPFTGADLYFARTTNGGANWGNTQIVGGAVRQIAVWFDQETPGDSGTIVNIGWLDATDNKAYYVTVDVSDASVGTIRTVAAGITVSSGTNDNRIGLTKAVNGNIIFAFSTQSEIACYKSSDLFATAGTKIADPYETATEEDWLLLYPADVDTGDACAVFLDQSANALSVKMYDDSEDTWTETAIASSIVNGVFWMNMDAAIRHSDSHLLLVSHTEIDTAGDDLKTWDITVDSIAGPTVAAKTNIYTDQNESAQAGILINQQNNDVYVAYLKGGTWIGSVDVVYHKSSNGMGAWGAEEAYSETTDDIRNCPSGRTVGDSGGRVQFSFYNDDLTSLYVNLVNDVEIAAAAAGRPLPQRVLSGPFAGPFGGPL